MALLDIEDNLKIGKQEILLGHKTVTRCGSQVEGLLANDLSVLNDDGSVVPLIDWITARCSGNCQQASATIPHTVIVTYAGNFS